MNSKKKPSSGFWTVCLPLYTWKTRYQKHPEQPFVGSGKLRDADAELRKLRQQVKDLEQENEFLKKASAFFAKNLK